MAFSLFFVERKSSKFQFVTKKVDRPRVYIVGFLVVTKGVLEPPFQT